MSAPRVGLIGARRRRRGLGPYIARFLNAAGAEVPCFLTTSEATRDEAAAQLAKTAKLRPRGSVTPAVEATSVNVPSPLLR